LKSTAHSISLSVDATISERLTNADFGGGVGAIYTHLYLGGIDNLLTAATGNSQQDQ
jgi:hypothetical protein